jgi:hypothetical protein
MRFVVAAHRCTDTNVALAAAAEAVGVAASVLSPRDTLRVLEPGDVALGRLDVRSGLDGMESGSAELERLAADGVQILNRPSSIVIAHDKLLTARALRRSEPVAALPSSARTLSLSAVAAIRGDLVGVDLLPTRNGYVVSELNGAVDFLPHYALDLEDVYTDAVLELLRVARDRRALQLVGA